MPLDSSSCLLRYLVHQRVATPLSRICTRGSGGRHTATSSSENYLYGLIVNMRFLAVLPMFLPFFASTVNCSPVETGIVTGGRGVYPEYYMTLESPNRHFSVGFTFQLAYNTLNSYYGALTVCINDFKSGTCGAAYLNHGGVGDDRWSYWEFKGTGFIVYVRLWHKGDGTITSYSIKDGMLEYGIIYYQYDVSVEQDSLLMLRQIPYESSDSCGHSLHELMQL
ncbi:uncharacterized protein L969DRAFT_94736 [Mixia osmundae IAM 14324]|uniref:Uncharacterized protein n=1 Tax=Mixia osmundae (strain CBS 9802 / IAM 14324 / JCM 22182 / KY 12970) TaxID=764103 RepID=G7E434_MIXOS|nr:uncharacterized protein L969DRAFT_94736 [Mixia osmundae IAM 14324]KEI39688.1 hypothetical protein L969DRAFT_94736 [Mixia osmundae IAM 14324]GAA97594.1 hypothetical protein E5Q_04272 [Mixia osmundae IAM 14324]